MRHFKSVFVATMIASAISAAVNAQATTTQVCALLVTPAAITCQATTTTTSTSEVVELLGTASIDLHGSTQLLETAHAQLKITHADTQIYSVRDVAGYGIDCVKTYANANYDWFVCGVVNAQLCPQGEIIWDGAALNCASATSLGSVARKMVDPFAQAREAGGLPSRTFNENFDGD